MAEKIEIYIMGKKYKVPETLTIMDAMEYAGYHIKRGCGCRSGFCGACGTVFRIAGDKELKVGLACQTKVEDQMYLAQLPFFPASKPTYSLEELDSELDTISYYFPEIFRCVGCNSCTKACPQGLNVMQYIAYAQRGDFEKCAEESFDCIACGLCASRCPANIIHYQVGLMVRRLYSKYEIPEADHVQKRVAEINSGRYDQKMKELINADIDELKDIYNNRNISS